MGQAGFLMIVVAERESMRVGCREGALARTLTLSGTNFATSTTPFTVNLSVDFTISGAPATSTAVRGTSSTALIQMTSAGGLANLVNLAATGLPAGVTATLSAPVVTLFQPVTVTVK